MCGVNFIAMCPTLKLSLTQEMLAYDGTRGKVRRLIHPLVILKSKFYINPASSFPVGLEKATAKLGQKCVVAKKQNFKKIYLIFALLPDRVCS